MRFLEEIETLPELKDHLPCAVDPRAEVEVFTLEVEYASADTRDIVAGHHAARRLERLQFTFGLLTTPAPGRQFIGQVREQSLEIGQRLLVRSNVW